MKYFFLYLIIINALALALMRADKRKAVKDAWRIPEAVLMGSAVIGGSLGAILGMELFRHKTKHLKFKLGLPAILVAQLLLAGIIWWLCR